MSFFQSIEVFAKRFTSLKDSSVESSQSEVPSLKPIGASATAVKPCSVDDEYLLGLEYKNNSQFLQAIEKFKSVENQAPGYREIYPLLQETYALAAEKEISDKNYISALPLLKKSQALSTSSQTIATLLAHKAYCEHHLGQIQQSLETVKKAITICHDTVVKRYKTQIHELGWESLFRCPIELPSARVYLPLVNVLSSRVDHLNFQNLEHVLDKEADNRCSQAGLESNHAAELSLKTKEIDALLLKVNQLSQKVSDNHNTSDAYVTKLQDSETLLQSLRTNYLAELSAKDNELDQLKQIISQLSGEVDLLQSSIRTERDEFTTEIDNLKEQLNAVQSPENKANENVSADQTSNVLSTQEISILNNSEFWSEFKKSPSPSKLISNFVWEKSRSDLFSTKYSCLTVNDLAKQLNLELISDSSDTIGKYLALTLYDFLNRTVVYDIDTVILCTTALITLVDAQTVDNFIKPTTIELPTVTNPSSDGHNFAIPRPPNEESIPIQEPQQISDMHLDLKIPADNLDIGLIRKKLLETEKVSILLRGIFVDEDDSAQDTANISISEKNLLKLDETHSAFLCVMLTKRIWHRDELEKLASGAKLLLDGVLHTINEEVYDAYGEPLFDGEKAIELNLDIVQQILATTDQYGSIS